MAAGTGTARTGTGEPRPEKVAVVTEVRERLSASNGALLTEYRGLKVADLARLRHSLRESGGEYGIYKNTLVRRAAVDLGLDDMVDLLVGPTAIAFVTGDPVAVAKSLRDFAKTSPNLVVKGGLLGKKVLTAAEATALADVAPRDVVLAQLAGALAAPLVKMAGLLQALPRNFAYGLKALLDLKAADEPAPGPGRRGPRSGGRSRRRRPSRPSQPSPNRPRPTRRQPRRPSPTLTSSRPPPPTPAPVETDTAPADDGPGRDRHRPGRRRRPRPRRTATETDRGRGSRRRGRAPTRPAPRPTPTRPTPDTSDAPAVDASVDRHHATDTAPEATDTEETQES